MSKQQQLPWIIPERCEGCTDCTAACKKGCLAMHQTKEPGVFVPWLDDAEACNGCGRCEMACPWGAICMTSFVEEARQRLCEKHPASPASHPLKSTG